MAERGGFDEPFTQLPAMFAHTVPRPRSILVIFNSASA